MLQLHKLTCTTELWRRTIGLHCHNGTNCSEIHTTPPIILDFIFRAHSGTYQGCCASVHLIQYTTRTKGLNSAAH